MSKVREVFNRENIVNALGRLGALRIKISHAALLELTLLALILTIAFVVRLLPARWGYYLSEFDPYYQYRLTKHITDEGLFSFANWRDYMSWWPYGRDVPHTSFPGLAVTASALYSIANALGIPMASSFAPDPLHADPVYNFVVIFPVIMGTLTVLAIYFFGKDIGGKEVGLFAALFLALNASYIGRTELGFFDDETVGVFGILLISLFFLRAVDPERTLKQSLLYGIASGLSLGWLFSSWGASRYAVGLLLVLVAALLLLRRYSPNLLLAYGATFFVGLLIAVNVPYLGLQFLREITNIVVLGLFLILLGIEVPRHIKTSKMRRVFTLGFFSFLVIMFLALLYFGYVGRLESKYLAVINPFERLLFPIVESVQEHRPAAWGTFYYDLGIGIFFIPVGLYFAAQNPTNRNLFLIIFGLTSVYFASSIVRLTVVLAASFCLLWALALVRILRPFITVMKEVPSAIRRKTRFEAHVGREFSVAFLILIFLLLTITFVLPSTEARIRGQPFTRVLEQAYSPTTIATSSVTIKPDRPITDWNDALTWMRNNPNVQAVVSWWDYGYWITTIANKPSLADNGTFNWTQIGKIGAMFMSNETEAIKIIQDWNKQAQNMGKKERITHVVVFTVFDSDGTDLSYGDESKWGWFARIAKQTGNPILDDKAYGNITGRGNVEWTDLGKTTLIYKLLTTAKNSRVSTVVVPTLEHFQLAYASNMNVQSEWNRMDWSISGKGSNAVVAIYEVKY